MTDPDINSVDSSFNTAYLISQGAVVETSLVESAKFTSRQFSKIAGTVLWSLIIGIVFVVIVSCAVFIESDGFLSIIALIVGAIVTLVAVFYSVAAIKGMVEAAIGSNFMDAGARVRYNSTLLHLDAAEKYGIDVSDLRREIEKSHNNYVSSVVDVVGGKIAKPEDVEHIVNDFYDLSQDISSLAFIRPMTNKITKDFASMGISNFHVLISNKTNDEHIKDIVYLAGNKQLDDSDMEKLRGLFLRQQTLEDIVKLWSEPNI